MPEVLARSHVARPFRVVLPPASRTKENDAFVSRFRPSLTESHHLNVQLLAALQRYLLYLLIGEQLRPRSNI